MFRRSATVLTNLNIDASMFKWSQNLKRRNPNERFLAAGQLLYDNLRRFHSYFIALGIVMLITVNRQYSSSEPVRLPIQDGRSLVT